MSRSISQKKIVLCNFLVLQDDFMWRCDHDIKPKYEGGLKSS